METVTFIPQSEVVAIASKVFEQEKARILEVLPEVEAHHIGGTSIPGVLTKGDLDINLRVREEDFEEVVEKLKSLYQVAQHQNWTDTFASFKSDDLEVDLGVQVSVIGSKEDTFLLLRDTLIKNPELVEEYNRLKRKYEGKPMEEYRKEKSQFCEKVTTQVSIGRK